MATFPLPASMIATGNGPNQIPVRDNDSKIPGVPVVFHRTLTDEAAEVVRELVPSGFVRGGIFKDTLEVSPFDADRIYLDTTAGCELVVDGYRVELPLERIDIELAVSPVTGTRDDAVFIEFWFERVTEGRALRYRVRTASGINFATYPDGLGDPVITAQGFNAVVTPTAFVKTHAQFPRLTRDTGLYFAALTAGENDPLSERGLDSNPYRLVYALPLARVKRLNRTTYNQLTNANGGSTYTAGAISPRPDGLWYDAINKTYQLVDLRRQVSFVPLSANSLMRQALVQHLQNKLVAQGVLRSIVRQLDLEQLRSVFSDQATAAPISVPTNLVRYSHFTTDSNSNGLADGWAAYVTGVVVGTRAMASPAGQQLTRTATDAANSWGISTDITGFHSKKFNVRIGYVATSANVNTKLVIAGYRSNGTEVFKIELGTLATPAGVLKEYGQIITSSAWETDLTIRVYLTGGTANITLKYVDIRTDTRSNPIMEVTDGSIFKVPLTAEMDALGASYDSLTAYDVINGGTIAGTVTILGDGTAQFQPSAIGLVRDLRLQLAVEYPTGGGFAELFPTITRAWDAGGFVSLIHQSVSSQTVTPHEANTLITAGEVITAYNPGMANKGTVVTLKVAGNTTSTYTLPVAAYGRNILMPVAVRVAGLAVTLESCNRSALNGTWTITLDSGQTVASNAFFEVDVAVDAPVLVWDDAAAGVTSVAVATLLQKKVDATGTEFFIAVPGVSLGLCTNVVVNSVIVNNVAQPLAVAVTTDAANKSVVGVTFPNPLSIGDDIEVMVLVSYEMYKGSGISVAYPQPIQPVIVPSGSDFFTIVSDPVLLVHTKGTGGDDGQADFGTSPFIKQSTLLGELLGFEGETPYASVLYDIPTQRNALKSAPLHAGRRLQVSELSHASLRVETKKLDSATPHAVVLAMLVLLNGKKLLLTLTKIRTDDDNLIDTGAVAAFYELDGRLIELSH